MKRKINLKDIAILVMMVLIILLTIALGNSRIKIAEYENVNAELISKNNSLTNEVSDLTEKVSDLNDNIYNLFEKQPYTLKIKHNNSLITYEQSSFGLFDSFKKITTTSSLIGE